MGVWRNAMSYLGLGPDEDYDEYDVAEAPDASPTQVAAARAAAESPEVLHEAEPAIRPLTPKADGDGPASRPRTSVVRPLPSTVTAKPKIIAPASFNDAQQVADGVKERTPVIMNLQGCDRELARRLIDFASGLCYGLGGQMERVADQVYLLTPADVEVSADDRRRLQERGLVD